MRNTFLICDETFLFWRSIIFISMKYRLTVHLRANARIHMKLKSFLVDYFENPIPFKKNIIKRRLPVI